MNRVLIAVGDLHLHFWKAFAQGNGTENSRFNATLWALRASLERARELDDPWIQCGDWVHTVGYSNNPVVTSLIDLLNEYEDVEKLTVWGNHDARSAGGAIKAQETVAYTLSKAVPTLTLLNGTFYKCRNGLVVYGEGHQPDPNLLEIATELGTPADVGIFHQTVMGSKLPSGITTDYGLPPGWLTSRFSLSIVGDVHQPQVLSEGRILVPGSLEAHNFGDLGPRGYWYCSLGTDSGSSLEFIPSASPQFVTVDSPAKVKNDGNFYRITGSCDDSELPDNATVISSPKTAVEQRNIIKEGASLRDVLEAWLLNNLPENTELVNSTPEKYIAAALKYLGTETPTQIKPIKLLYVDIQNFLSYQEETLMIDSGVTLVVGEGRDYSSNGAGKTSLFEAIFWALFGKTTKGVSSDEVIRRGAEDCVVSLDFGEITVTRTRTKSGGGQIRVNEVSGDGSVHAWQGGQKELSEQLSKYLGVTPELYQSLTYFSQSKLLLFSQATDSERKSMLSDLCGLDVYQKASTAARSEVTQLESKLSNLNHQLSLEQVSVVEATTRQEELHKKRDEFENAALATITRAQDEIKQFEYEIGHLDLLESDKVEEFETTKIKSECVAEEQLEEYKKKHRDTLSASREEALEKYRTWLHSNPTPPPVEKIQQRMGELQEEIKSTQTALGVKRDERGNIRALLRSAQLQADQYRNIPDRCPTCGSLIDVSAQVKLRERAQEHIKTYTEELVPLEKEEAALATSLTDLTSKLRQVEGFIYARRAWVDAQTQHETTLAGIDRLIEQQVDALAQADVRAAIAGIRAKYDSDMRSLRQHVMSEKSRINGQIILRKEQIAEFEVNPYQDLLSKTIEEVNWKREKYNKDLAEVEVLRTQRTIALYWMDGFSRKGIQSLLMEEIAAAFNQIRSLVFPLLTRGVYDVQFSTVSQTKEGESRERTDFIIRDRGALVSYESLSGGQRRRIDLGVMLALSLAVSRTRNVPGVFGLLILDEVFGFLDEDGVESLYSVLGEANKVVPSIYAITHNPNLMSLFEKTLKVIQDKHGISTLQLGARG